MFSLASSILYDNGISSEMDNDVLKIRDAFLIKLLVRNDAILSPERSGTTPEAQLYTRFMAVYFCSYALGVFPVLASTTQTHVDCDVSHDVYRWFLLSQI